MTNLGVLLVVMSMNGCHSQLATTTWLPSMEACEAAQQVLLEQYPPVTSGWTLDAGWRPGFTTNRVSCHPLGDNQ